jgi:hypothetical protein
MALGGGPTIRERDRDAIMQALRAGVVPRQGFQHIQVGRIGEIKALVRDLDRIASGGAAVRFVIGEYGSGKTFFLNLVRSIALEKKLVTMNADLAPDRRLHASGGQARSLYTELAHNIATRAKAGGGAMASIVERFISTALAEAAHAGKSPSAVIQERLSALSEHVGGYDFASVVECYWRAHDQGADKAKNDAVKWLRGEFTTKTDARIALGVRSIIDDESFYDHLKLMSQFVTMAGFSGLLVCLDEMVNLYKLSNTQARTSNYEQILRIVNDTLQGSSTNCGFVFGGTPEFLLDPRRGLYSYAALASRLTENTFATDGLVDYNGPVIRLANLSKEDLYVLLMRLRHLQALGDESRYAVPDEALNAFMAHCSKRIGDAYFRTPRTTITSFLNLLSILEQNPAVSWTDLIEKVEIVADRNPDLDPLTDSTPLQSLATKDEGDDELASFKL